MDRVKGFYKKHRTILTVLLATLIIIFCTMSFEAVHTTREIENTITDLCIESMMNIELNLRQGDPISSEYLYRFDQLTAIYPDTYYAILSDTLLVLEDSSVSSLLTPEDRVRIADNIARTYDNDMEKEEWEPLIYDVENVLYPYLEH